MQQCIFCLLFPTLPTTVNVVGESCFCRKRPELNTRVFRPPALDFPVPTPFFVGAVFASRSLVPGTFCPVKLSFLSRSSCVSCPVAFRVGSPLPTTTVLAGRGSDGDGRVKGEGYSSSSSPFFDAIAPITSSLPPLPSLPSLLLW